MHGRRCQVRARFRTFRDVPDRRTNALSIRPCTHFTHCIITKTASVRSRLITNSRKGASSTYGLKISYRPRRSYQLCSAWFKISRNERGKLGPPTAEFLDWKALHFRPLRHKNYHRLSGPKRTPSVTKVTKYLSSPLRFATRTE